MSFFENNNSSGLKNFYKSINDGMRANIDTLNPITGMQYVDLTFNHNEGNGTIVQTSKYEELPMVTKSAEGIMSSVNKIMDKIAKLPLNKLVDSFDKVINDTSAPIAQAEDLLKELKKSVININKMTSKKAFISMPNEVNNTLKELTNTLKKTGKVVDGYSDNSMLTKQLSYTLEILTKTSREMDVFLRMLNRKPNSLIFGE
jgi:paraquat-inducible protein B